MKNAYRPRRNFEGLKSRRMKAGRMFGTGSTQAEVARTLKVTPVSVHRWHKQWKEKGLKGLRGTGRVGCKPRLSDQQLKEVDRILRKGPRHHGFETELWTLPRMASVIKKKTGVQYHPGHVWKILGQLKWSLQRPAKRARQRNEEAVQQWKKTAWAAIKKKPAARRHGSSFRTNQEFRKNLPSAVPGHPGEKPLS